MIWNVLSYVDNKFFQWTKIPFPTILIFKYSNIQMMGEAK